MHSYRFVDDTFVIHQESQKQLFLDHINNVDPAIKFTVEGNQENGSILFLGALVKAEADNSLSISVYRKPTHTDQYLQWDSHHNLAAKYSVIGTLIHRAKTVCTGPELFNKEIQHLGEALSRCKYPKWALDKVQSKFITSNWEDGNTQQDNRSQRDNSENGNTTEGIPKDKPSICHIVIPYTQGIGESIKKNCSKYGIQTHFKGNRIHKAVVSQTQGPGPYGQEEWSHLLVPV